MKPTLDLDQSEQINKSHLGSLSFNLRFLNIFRKLNDRFLLHLHPVCIYGRPLVVMRLHWKYRLFLPQNVKQKALYPSSHPDSSRKGLNRNISA